MAQRTTCVLPLAALAVLLEGRRFERGIPNVALPTGHRGLSQFTRLGWRDVGGVHDGSADRHRVVARGTGALRKVTLGLAGSRARLSAQRSRRLDTGWP